MKKDNWICNDIDAATGELLIQTEEGEGIATVFNEKNVPVIKAAPELKRLLKIAADMISKNVHTDTDGRLYKEMRQAIKSAGQ